MKYLGISYYLTEHIFFLNKQRAYILVELYKMDFEICHDLMIWSKNSNENQASAGFSISYII